jgi:uncharacterized protein (DUF1330 family)
VDIYGLCRTDPLNPQRALTAVRWAPVGVCAKLAGMTAYVISEVEIVDEVQGNRYRELAAASIAQHGGRYLVRGADPEVPEGEWPPAQRVVVVEFPTMEQLQGWYRSAEYAEALAVSKTALRRRLLFVGGV